MYKYGLGRVDSRVHLVRLHKYTLMTGTAMIVVSNRSVIKKHMTISVKQVPRTRKMFVYLYNFTFTIWCLRIIKITHYLVINNRSKKSLNLLFIGTLMGTKMNLNLTACLITLTFKIETQSWKHTVIFNEDIAELFMVRSWAKNNWIWNLCLMKWIKPLPLVLIYMQNLSSTKEKQLSKPVYII